MLSSLLSVVVAVDTIVAATCFSPSIDRVSTPRQVMDTSIIQNLSSSSVADALKFFAGVQIKDYGGLGGMKTINVRSLGTQHTGVYIDGVRITNCQNGTVDLGKYSLQNMESVELYNANKVSSLMTASEYASASTVYLTTRRPTHTSNSIRYSYGSFSTHRVNYHSDIKTRVFIDAEALYSKGNYPFTYKSEYEDTTGVRSNSDIRQARLEAGYFDDHLKIHLYAFASDRGLPGGIVRRLSDRYGDVGREYDINSFVQASYTNSFHNHAFKVNARYAYDYLRANTDFPENCFIHYDNNYHQQDFYLGAVYRFNIFKPLSISATSDLRISHLRCNVKAFSPVTRIDSKSVVSLQGSYKQFTYSASALLTYITDYTSAPAKPLVRVSPSVHFSYSPIPSLSIRAFYKEIFRAPTLNDLYYTRVGRRNLKPETTLQADLGISYSFKGLVFQADAYYNHVNDKIICIPQGGSYDWKMTNRGFVPTIGVDLSARYNYKWLSLFCTFTYQNSKDMTDPEDDSYGMQFLYTPKFSVSAVASASFKGFTMTLSHMFCSKRNWTYCNDVLPSYNCTDAKLQYKANKLFSISLECNDVFDVRYELIQRWPLPGRRFNLTTTFTF